MEPRRTPVTLLVAALLAAAPVLGCNFIEAFSRSARIEEMTPGQSVSGGDLDCWLTLVFDEAPYGMDPLDVTVRFDSEALVAPAEFDWAYIAEHDVVKKGSGFGSGYAPNEATSPDAPPPPGQEIRVKFRLEPKEQVEHRGTLYLEVELYRAGSRQDTTRSSIEHAYASQPDGFF